MGSSVKFVSRINGSFSKKNHGSFFFIKMPKPGGEGGGGSEGGLAKDHTFFYPFITWFSCGVKIILPGFRKMFPCFYCFYLPPLVLVLYHLVVGRDRAESLSLSWNYR